MRELTLVRSKGHRQRDEIASAGWLHDSGWTGGRAKALDPTSARALGHAATPGAA